jgi:hypothetical protein
MSTTSTATKTTRTRKAPAKATPEVVNHQTGQTADEVKTTYVATATGRAARPTSARLARMPTSPLMSRTRMAARRRPRLA